MKLIGFNFTKINCERISDNLEGLKINTKIDPKNLSFIDTKNKNKEKIVKFEFNYYVNYDPNFAKIELSGEIFISGDSNILKSSIEKWKKNKNIDEDFRLFLFNILLRKANLKALQLEDEMNLPIHLPFPIIKKENNQ